MNHIQGSINSQIKTNISTDNDSADIVFLGESPGFKNVPVDSSPINSKNINVGFQNLNNLHVTPTKQKSTGHYNNTSPKSFNNSPRLVSPKHVNNLCNGSPNFRAAGPMSPTNTGTHLLPKSPTVCRYQITNSPSYKISNRRNSKKQTQVDQTDVSVTNDKTSPPVLRAEDLWDKMQLENKQTTNSNTDIKNHQSDNDNLIVIDPETTPVNTNDSLPTTNSSAEKKSGDEENEDDKKTKEIEKNLCAVEMNIKEKDEIEIERPSSRESVDSNGSQSKKKKRGRPKKQPPEIYIENLETGEGRDIDSPVSDISSTAAAFQAAVFPICDDKTDKDYVPASDQKKRGRSKSRRNSQGKQCNLQKNKTENRNDDIGRTISDENKKDDINENKTDRKRPLLSESDKSEVSVTSEETVQDKHNSLTSLNDSSSSLGNHLQKDVDEKQFKSFKSLSTSVRNARMYAKRARYAKIMSQGKTSEKEINNQTTVVNSNVMELEQDSGEVLKNESKTSQDTNGRVNDKNETNCDPAYAETFDVKTHAESSSLSTNNFQTSHKNIYEKKSRPDKQKRKGVVKNIGSVISSLFGENFMSMADSSGFVVNVRLDVQKKTSEADDQNSTHKDFTKEEEKDSGCLSANIFKDVSSSSDPQEGCSHSTSKKSRIDKIDPKTLSNAELCAILKKRISDHPVIDNEMKAAVMDSIQYAKKLLDS